LHTVHGVDFNHASASVVMDYLALQIVLHRTSLVKFKVAAVFFRRRWVHSLVRVNHGIFYSYTLVSAGIIGLGVFLYLKLSQWLCDPVETSVNSCSQELVFPLWRTLILAGTLLLFRLLLVFL